MYQASQELPQLQSWQVGRAQNAEARPSCLCASVLAAGNNSLRGATIIKSFSFLRVVTSFLKRVRPGVSSAQG